jgi:hypothetical protein
MEILENTPDELLRSVSAISLENHLEAYSREQLEQSKTRLEGFRASSWRIDRQARLSES